MLRLGLGNKIGLHIGNPTIPTIGTLVVVSDTEITVPYTSDYPVEVWYSDDNGATYSKHGDSASTPYSMTGLTQGTLYYVNIRSVNGSKFSAFGSVVSSQTTGIPLEDDLNLWIKSRTGLSLIDDFSNNASIKPSCGIIDTTNYLNQSINDFGIDDSSGYVEVLFYFDGSIKTHRLFSSADSATANYFFAIYMFNKYIYFDVKNNITFNNSHRSTNILSAGWYIARWTWDGLTYTLTLNSQSTDITKVTGETDGKGMSNVPNRDNISIGVLKIDILLTSASTFLIGYVDYNNKDKWIVTGIGLYVFDIIGNIHFTWTGTSHIFYDANASSYLLDSGYSLYRKAGLQNEYVSYKNGNPNDVSIFLDGYTKDSDHAGNMTNHNLANSKITMVGANWDRSNTTIFNAIARTGYYEASKPLDWHITELTINKLILFFNSGFEGLNFIKCYLQSYETQSYLMEIIGYTTNKIGTEKDRVLRYTNDYVGDYSQIYTGEKYDGIHENSITIKDEITYKTRNSHSKYKFYYSGNIIDVKVKPTIYAAYPALCQLTVFVNGIYNQVIQFTDENYKTINLPVGKDKLITLIEGESTKIGNDILGTFITSILSNDSYSKKTEVIPSEKIIILADSIGSGSITSIPSVQSFANLFWIENDKDISTLGWGSATLKYFAGSSDLINTTVAQIQTLFGTATTKKLIIQVGTNDGGIDNTAAATFKSYYENLLDAIHTADSTISIYCLSPIFRSDANEAAYMVDYRAAILDICNNRPTYTLYRDGLTLASYPADYSDTVHLNVSGHKKAKNIIYTDMYT